MRAAGPAQLIFFMVMGGLRYARKHDGDRNDQRNATTGTHRQECADGSTH